MNKKRLTIEFREEISEIMERLISSINEIKKDGNYDETLYDLNQSACNLLGNLDKYSEYH